MATDHAELSTTAAKALRVLEAVAASTQPITLADVAEQVGLDRSTAYRMLSTLVGTGYLLRDTATKRYTLSFKLIALSRNLLAENEATRASRQVLEELTAATGESAYLNVLDGYQTLVIQKVKGTQLVSVDFDIGDRSELHCTSIGKALAAFQEPTFVQAVIAAGLPSRARNTITDPDVFREELRRVRTQGYAIDDHEFEDTMRCIAAPVFEQGNRVRMGISISGPDSRFSLAHLKRLRTPLLRAAGMLSERLGGMALGG